MGRETIHTGQTEPLRHESNGTHFEPQRASVRARGLVITCLFKPNTEKLEELSRWQVPQLGYPCWAAPVLANRLLYLRDEDHLVCYDLAK